MYEDVFRAHLVRRLRKIIKAHKEIYGGSTEESIAIEQAADAIEELSMKLHGDEAAIAGMKREIERMVVAGKPRWIPVTERLPEFFVGHGEEERSFCADCAWHDPERQRCSSESEAENCVLWEPNAEPPKEEAEKWLREAKDRETAVRADAVLSFLCEVKLTLDAAPTVIPASKEGET